MEILTILVICYFCETCSHNLWTVNIKLPAESFDYNYFSEGSEGLKVALVHHLDMPIVRQIGFHISPGTENQIAVTPTLISTSNDAMVRFSPDRRDCYSEGEIRDGGGSIALWLWFIFFAGGFAHTVKFP